jgi:hypothetical protein
MSPWRDGGCSTSRRPAPTSTPRRRPRRGASAGRCPLERQLIEQLARPVDLHRGDGTDECGRFWSCFRVNMTPWPTPRKERRRGCSGCSRCCSPPAMVGSGVGRSPRRDRAPGAARRGAAAPPRVPGDRRSRRGWRVPARCRRTGDAPDRVPPPGARRRLRPRLPGAARPRRRGCEATGGGAALTGAVICGCLRAETLSPNTSGGPRVPRPSECFIASECRGPEDPDETLHCRGGRS